MLFSSVCALDPGHALPHSSATCEVAGVTWMQVQSLAELLELHRATGAAEKAEDSRAYLARKQQDLTRAQQAAGAAAADHAAILGWGMQPAAWAGLAAAT